MSKFTDDGFTGTINEFLDWLVDTLVCGGVRTSVKPGDGYTVVEMYTGGYSDDEELLERVNGSVFGALFGVSYHRGGLYVYHICNDLMQDLSPKTWLFPTPEYDVKYPAPKSLRIRGVDDNTLFYCDVVDCILVGTDGSDSENVVVTVRMPYDN